MSNLSPLFLLYTLLLLTPMFRFFNVQLFPAYITPFSLIPFKVSAPPGTLQLFHESLPFISSSSLRTRSPTHAIRSVAANSQSPPGHVYDLEVAPARSTLRLSKTCVLEKKAEQRCWHKGNGAAPFHLLTCLLPGLPLGSLSFQFGMQHDKGDNAGSTQAQSCLSQHFYQQRSPLPRLLKSDVVGSTSLQRPAIRLAASGAWTLRPVMG